MTCIMTDIAIVGAGIAGLEAARNLAQKGFSVIVLEKSDHPGGHVGQWQELYPFGRNGHLIIQELCAEAKYHGAHIMTNARVIAIFKNGDGFLLGLADGKAIASRTMLIASGFSLFDARLKEELGYGLYPGVMTASDLEQAWAKGINPFPHKIKPVFGIAHCVGSRDLKCGHNYCSKVCCMVAVKTAISLKKRYPDCHVTNFYMDLRMFDHGYEELYHKAQLDAGVQFVRGRVSEVAPDNSGKIRIKAEDTLLGQPVQLQADGLILMTGMVPADEITCNFNTTRNSMNFLSADTLNIHGAKSAVPGMFAAGCCKGPMTLRETVNDARSSVLAIEQFLTSAQ